MSHSITETLYEWMHQRRIESEVAAEMGIPVATLSAELSPTRPQAKLGADKLVPLFEAIRNIGYGSELRGVVYRFIRDLKGDEREVISAENMVPQVLSLTRSLGILAECADGVSKCSDPATLEKMRTMLRTEVLPVVLQMESILSTRIEALRPYRKFPVSKAKLALAGNQK